MILRVHILLSLIKTTFAFPTTKHEKMKFNMPLIYMVLITCFIVSDLS
jgi:hypothetical protein